MVTKKHSSTGTETSKCINHLISMDVEKGTHSLQVVSQQYYFEQIRVDVDENIRCFIAPVGTSWDLYGQEIPYPLELAPLGILNYFTVLN